VVDTWLIEPSLRKGQDADSHHWQGGRSSAAGHGFTVGDGDELLKTLIAAKKVGSTIPLLLQGGSFIDGHPASRVFGECFRFAHGHIPFLVVGFFKHALTDE